MKIINFTVGLILLFLTGCASQYGITESELENYLADELHFEIKEGNQLFGIDIRINNIHVKLGHKTDMMAVSALSIIKVRNPLMPFEAELETTFEAKPWYDAKNHSVYLKDLKLVEIKSTPKDLDKAIQNFSPKLMRFLTHFLETQPVYVLDTDESSQALLVEMIKRIQVQPGTLQLIFDE